MWHRLKLGLSVVIAITFCGITQAQDISVKLNGTDITGSPFPANSAITVPVGTVSGETLVIISDANPGTSGVQHSVGKITVVGNQSGTGRLSILVARNATALSVSPLNLLSEGLVDFGTTTSAGLEIIDDGSPTTHVLRDHTRLALAVTGDVRGNISVGQVFRLQVDGIFSGTSYVSGGNVSATIEATATDNTDLTNVIEPIPGQPDVVHEYFAAEYIRAGRSIIGNISAVGGFLDTSVPSNVVWRQSSIRRVIVGPQDSATGIQGDITADNGKIGVINTTGPIGAPASGGTPERRVQIRAATGIDEVRAVSYLEADSETDYPKVAKPLDFHADIRTNYNFPRTGLVVKGFPSEDAPLRLVQTNGSFFGSITAANIVSTGRGSWDPIHPNANFHSGILVKGIIDAPINVEYVVSKCDIMGWTFTSPITVGVMYQGIIIAHGRDDPNPPSSGPTPGFIPSIDIGNRAFTPYSTWTPTTVPPYGLFARGLCGSRRINSGGLIGTLPGVFNQGFASTNWHFGYTPDFWLYGFCGDGCATSPITGSADSLIRATQINTLSLKQMRILDEGNTTDKKTPPRVEALVIGSLSIGDLREGVIWSGAYQWDNALLDPANAPLPFLSGNPDQSYIAQSGVRQCPYDPTHDYASIVTATVGCVGHFAHVWFQDCPPLHGLAELSGRPARSDAERLANHLDR